MSMNSILADGLTRLRNAQLARKGFTLLKSSNLTRNVLKVLLREGYIADFQEVEQAKGISLLKVDLKYYEGQPVMSEITMISKPGRRVHTSIKNLQKAHGGLSIYVLSTPKGVMSDWEALKSNVGGEILAKIC